MNSNITIDEFERDFLTNEQLAHVVIEDNGENLVDLAQYENSIELVVPPDNLAITGNTIYVRFSVAEKLSRIQTRLHAQGFGLKITDGYRPLSIQKKYWNEYYAQVAAEFPNLSPQQITEKTSFFVAHPDFSFHPTGGAVDLTIIDAAGKELWMGTEIDTFSETAYSFFQDIPQECREHRAMLFNEMDREGFYNLPSEWWHFSYGTIDWALYFKKPCAIYGAIDYPFIFGK